MTGLSRSVPRSYFAGCVLVVLAGLTWSVGVLCVRGASSSDAWQYLFWRAVAFSAVLALVAVWRHGVRALAPMWRMGGFAWLSVFAMMTSQACFIAAIKAGSTAEVFFLMSLAPLMAAVVARPLLGERIGALSLLAIAVALGGVALMTGLSVRDGGAAHSPDGAWLARGLALGTAASYALYSLSIRGARHEELDAALVASGLATVLLSASVLLWLGVPFAAAPRDIGLAVVHGGAILAVALLLFARGSRVVPGVTLAMLSQAETVAAPLWTWAVFGETTTLAVIAGGALILVAVVMQAADGARQSSGAGTAAGADISRS